MEAQCSVPVGCCTRPPCGIRQAERARALATNQPKRKALKEFNIMLAAFIIRGYTCQKTE